MEEIVNQLERAVKCIQEIIHEDVRVENIEIGHSVYDDNSISLNISIDYRNFNYTLGGNNNEN